MLIERHPHDYYFLLINYSLSGLPRVLSGQRSGLCMSVYVCVDWGSRESRQTWLYLASLLLSPFPSLARLTDVAQLPWWRWLAAYRKGGRQIENVNYCWRYVDLGVQRERAGNERKGGVKQEKKRRRKENYIRRGVVLDSRRTDWDKAEGEGWQEKIVQGYRGLLQEWGECGERAGGSLLMQEMSRWIECRLLTEYVCPHLL